jgi:hypothetical protein
MIELVSDHIVQNLRQTAGESQAVLDAVDV